MLEQQPLDPEKAQTACVCTVTQPGTNDMPQHLSSLRREAVHQLEQAQHCRAQPHTCLHAQGAAGGQLATWQARMWLLLLTHGLRAQCPCWRLSDRLAGAHAAVHAQKQPARAGWPLEAYVLVGREARKQGSSLNVPGACEPLRARRGAQAQVWRACAAQN